jgi:uncharacterized tellurite resistance protein B-like protein
MMNMIRRLFARGTPATEPLEPYLAVTALLVEAALADGVYVNLESDMIAEILTDAFGFDADRADKLLRSGEALAEEAVGSHQFTRHAKKLSLKDRIRVVEALYRVVLADGQRCDVEDSYVRHVAGLLHVDDISRATARRNAESARAGPR